MHVYFARYPSSPLFFNFLDDRTYKKYRAKNDIGNPVAAGLLAGGILSRNAGPKGMIGGAVAFAAFSAAIDMFLHRETSE